MSHDVVRLPETPDFDPADRAHWHMVAERFRETFHDDGIYAISP